MSKDEWEHFDKTDFIWKAAGLPWPLQPSSRTSSRRGTSTSVGGGAASALAAGRRTNELVHDYINSLGEREVMPHATSSQRGLTQTEAGVGIIFKDGFKDNRVVSANHTFDTMHT